MPDCFWYLPLRSAVGDFGGFAFEEEDLGDALAGVDAGREGGGVADLDGDVALPLGLEGGDVDDDAAAGVG